MRGIGVIIFLLFTIIVGWLAKGIIGRSFIRFAESLVERTPVVRSIYSGIKQISETIFAQSERSFETACLIEYPRKGIWALGFISTDAKGEIAQKSGSDGRDHVSVFLPTTPNPTSGFLLFVPRDDVIELEMTVEDAAKLVISAGLVYPKRQGAGDGRAAASRTCATGPRRTSPADRRCCARRRSRRPCASGTPRLPPGPPPSGWAITCDVGHQSWSLPKASPSASSSAIMWTRTRLIALGGNAALLQQALHEFDRAQLAQQARVEADLVDAVLDLLRRAWARRRAPAG